MKIKKRTVTVEALEHGELVERTATLHYSVYGPVIWENKLQIAVRDANANNLRGPDQWLAISKAENASQVVESERAIQGVPWVNTIGADDRRQRVLHGDHRGREPDEGLRRLGPATFRAGSLDRSLFGQRECELPESPGAIVPGILAGSRRAGADPQRLRRELEQLVLAREREQPADRVLTGPR